MLINMRKEIAPYLSNPDACRILSTADQCSTILLNTESLAVVAHNEDADVALLDHV